MNYVLKMMNSALITMNFVLKMMNSALISMNFDYLKDSYSHFVAKVRTFTIHVVQFVLCHLFSFH